MNDDDTTVASNGTVLDDDTNVSVPAASASAADQVPQPTRPSESPSAPLKGQPVPEDVVGTPAEPVAEAEAPATSEGGMPAATENVGDENVITDSVGDPVNLPASKEVMNEGNADITQAGLTTPNDVRREIRVDSVVEYYPENEQSVPSDIPEGEVNQGEEPQAQVVREPEAREELMRARTEGNPESAPLSPNQSEEASANDTQTEEYQGTVTEPADPNAYQATFTPDDDDGTPFEKKNA